VQLDGPHVGPLQVPLVHAEGALQGRQVAPPVPHAAAPCWANGMQPVALQQPVQLEPLHVGVTHCPFEHCCPLQGWHRTPPAPHCEAFCWGGWRH
jgi:hypothetical protein